MNKCFLLVAGYPESLINFRGALISELVNNGFAVHVAAPGLTPNSDAAVALRNIGAIPHDFFLERTGTGFFSDIRAFFSLCALMRTIKPQHALFYTVKPIVYGAVAASLFKVRNIYALITGLGYAFQTVESGRLVHTLLRLVVAFLYKNALAKVKVTFFQNPDDQQLFISQGLISRQAKTVVVSGSGVDVTRYSVAPLPAMSQPYVFLLIARLLGAKGVREYVSAARHIKLRHPTVIFRLVGWIDENPDAIGEAELEKWVSEGIIEYLGRLSDVRSAIADCTVYVLPSYREGTPRTVLEAMSMGRPIITTDAPGCRETVVNGDNGFLVPVKAVDELVVAMEKFVLSPELVKKMGKRSREIAEAKYDVNAVNALMLQEMDITGAAE